MTDILFLAALVMSPAIGIVSYVIFGSPSKEFMESLENYRPPGHE